jgi:transposase
MQNQASDDTRPDPEVKAKARRRRHTAQYKLHILELADACTQAGSLGELLRREGLYASHLAQWRKQRREGTLRALQPQKRGPVERVASPLLEENERLRAENTRLQLELKKATTILEFQKKVSEIWGIGLMKQESCESLA